MLIKTEKLTPAICEIVLHRADRRNALSLDLLEQLLAALKAASSDPQMRVVILRGEGPVFCSGLDLREAGDDTLIERSAATLEQTYRTLRETPLVVIAAVHGGAYAGGAGLMAACDLVVAAENVRIGFPEARRGLLPALISRVLQPKVREGDLRALFLVGEPIDVQRACQMGLVQYVVPEIDLQSESRRIATSIVAGGPETIRQTKQLINDLYDSLPDAAEKRLAELHLSARRSLEAREGLAAFSEKRNPNWINEETP